jgi:hypothetical protein
MKTKIAVLMMLFAAITCFEAISQISKYRKIDADGAANIIFANKAIEKGKESSYELKSSFNSNEAIFCRCYFPKKYGDYKPRDDEEFVVDLWFNNKFLQRKVWQKPDAEWDQIQVYLLNTGDDDIKSFDQAISSAGSGTYKVRVLVGISRYQGTKDVIQPNGSIVKEKVFTMEYISKGDISLTVK